MTAASAESRWALLVARGLATGAPPARAEARSPWYVRIMLGVAAWIAAVFIMIFVGAAFAVVFEHAALSIGAGGLVCAGAAAILRRRSAGDFAGQLGFAVSLAGQALIGYGLAQALDRQWWAAALAMAAVQAVLFVAVPSFGHRIWVVGSGVLSAAFALGDLGLHALVPALVTGAFVWLWVGELDHGARGSTLRAAGYGLALASAAVTVTTGARFAWFLFGERAAPLGGAVGIWAGHVLAAAVLPWAVLLLLRREGVEPRSGPGALAIAGAAILGLASLGAPGVGPAAAILVVGFAIASRRLAGLGVIALLAYLGHYYYVLDTTLLVKSAWLAGTGLVLLAARLALRHCWPGATAEACRA